MSGQPTRAGWLPPLPAAWRRWAAFVRQPSLPDRADLSFGRAIKVIAPLFALDLLLMAILLGAVGAAIAFGFDMPEHMMDDMKLTGPLLAFFVIGAPVCEEILFRGWLSGRAGHVIGSLLIAVAGALFIAGNRPGAELWSFAALAAIAAAGLFVFLLRKRPAMRGFQRYFAWFYWLSVLLFAAVHLLNFPAAGPAMLPLVLPQFVLALILGYLRVHHGLWSAVLLHMLHNSVFMALVLAGTSAA